MGVKRAKGKNASLVDGYPYSAPILSLSPIVPSQPSTFGSFTKLIHFSFDTVEILDSYV